MLIQTLDPNMLVGQFADKRIRNQAIRQLIGGLTATELRSVKPSAEAKAALIRGLKHPNSLVRWWCLQLMDHIADESYIPHIIEALNDPIPKNRKHAIHALTCEVCKPDRCQLDYNLIPILTGVMENDPDESVRLSAEAGLAELRGE